MHDLLLLNRMITPKIITFIYWLLLLGCGIYGIVLLVGAFGTMKYNGWAGFGMLVLAPFAVVFGAVIARMYCEIMIVLFKMNEALQDIRSK